MKIVDGKPYIADISELIKEYYQRLGRDLSFQNIDDELKNPAKNIFHTKVRFWWQLLTTKLSVWWRIIA